MDVLQVILEFTTDGMEGQVGRLAGALARLGVKCHIHASHKGNAHGLSSDGVTVRGARTVRAFWEDFAAAPG